MSDLSTPSGGELYDRLGSDYDRFTTPIDKVIHPMRHLLMPDARGEVLEVAIASGKNLEFYPKDCRIVGLDPSKEQLAIASQRAERFGIPFELTVGAAESLPFDTGRFDTVVCVLGGCVFPKPVEAYRELGRVCRPGGNVLFIEHVYPKPWYLRALLTAIKPLAEWKIGCDPTRDILGYIDAAGLGVTEVRASRAMGIVLALKATPK